MNVPVDALFEAFYDERARARWLGEFNLDIGTVRPGKSMTAVWQDGSTRPSVGFYVNDAGKSRVAVAHEKIPDARRTDELEAFWRARMDLLKRLLEG